MPELSFKGKDYVRNHHLSVPHRPLELDAARSVGAPRLDGNLIIHGDNLHALKSLVPIYAGKVNCIYIDPPYNTGNEGWSYNDNVNSPQMQAWLKQNPVGIEDGLRHDKWCAMMWPRLVLLRELLAEDGVIFISIDDNEQHRLRMIMDEIFGGENFRNLIIIRRGVKSVQRQFKKIDRLNFGCEYALAYTKDTSFKFDHLTELLEGIKGGGWNNHWRGTDRPTMRYEIFGITPTSGQWRWSESHSLTAIAHYKRMLQEINNPEHKINQEDIDDWYLLQNDPSIDLLRLSSTGKPEHYIQPSNAKYLSNLWSDLKPNGSRQSEQIFGKKVFDNPKSTDLIRRLIRFACSGNKNALILDSFAGSGTTAHATLALNKQDGGNRKFILVECEDYADTITAERIRRVIKGVPTAKDEHLKNGLGGSFTYTTLGTELRMDDLLTGKNLPAFENIGTLLFHTATNEVIAPAAIDPKSWYLGESRQYHVWLIYKPDIEFLKDDTSALTLSRAEAFVKARPRGKRHLVFAPTRFVSDKTLRTENIPVDFQPLPWALYRVVSG